MVVRFSPIWNISTSKIRYYSARLGSNQETEYTKFRNKRFPSHQLELEILDKVIAKMGVRGAKPHYFKPETPAHALPSVPPEVKDANKKDYGIRLYCIYISPKIVILLNGDVKTSRHSPKTCPQVRQHFINAINIATKLEQAETDNFVRYVDFKIEFDDDFELEI